MNRRDAICEALTDVPKGRHGIELHRYITTVEGAWIDDDWVEAYRITWCWDCGTNRVEAEQRPFPSAWPEHLTGETGFCGYKAKRPGNWWDRPNGAVTG